MTWSYQTDLSRDLDKVRFRIGDTDTNKQLFSDEELLALLTGETVVGAAIKAVRGFIAKYAGDVTSSAKGIRAERGARVRQYRVLLTELFNEQQEAGDVALPVMTGTTVSDIAAARADPERPPQVAHFGMHDHPNTANDCDDVV